MVQAVEWQVLQHRISDQNVGLHLHQHQDLWYLTLRWKPQLGGGRLATAQSVECGSARQGVSEGVGAGWRCRGKSEIYAPGSLLCHSRQWGMDNGFGRSLQVSTVHRRRSPTAYGLTASGRIALLVNAEEGWQMFLLFSKSTAAEGIYHWCLGIGHLRTIQTRQGPNSRIRDDR